MSEKQQALSVDSLSSSASSRLWAAKSQKLKRQEDEAAAKSHKLHSVARRRARKAAEKQARVASAKFPAILPIKKKPAVKKKGPLDMPKTRPTHRQVVLAELKAAQCFEKKNQHRMLTLEALIRTKEVELDTFVDTQILAECAGAAAELHQLGHDDLCEGSTPFVPTVPRMCLNVLRLCVGDVVPETSGSPRPSATNEAKAAKRAAEKVLEYATAGEELKSRLLELEARLVQEKVREEEQLNQLAEETNSIVRVVAANFEGVEAQHSAAEKRLDGTNKWEVHEIRAFCNPPRGVLIALQSLGVLFGWGERGHSQKTDADKQRKSKRVELRFGEVGMQQREGKNKLEEEDPCCQQPALHAVGDTVRVQVLFLSGEECVIEICADRSVACLKCAVEAATGTPANQLMLARVTSGEEQEEQEGQGGAAENEEGEEEELLNSMAINSMPPPLVVMAIVKPEEEQCWYTSGRNPPCRIPSWREVMKGMQMGDHLLREMKHFDKARVSEDMRRTLQWCLDEQYHGDHSQLSQEKEMRAKKRAAERARRRQERGLPAAGNEGSESDGSCFRRRYPPLNCDGLARVSSLARMVGQWVLAVCAWYDIEQENAPHRKELQDVQQRREAIQKRVAVTEDERAKVRGHARELQVMQRGWEAYAAAVAADSASGDGSAGGSAGDKPAAEILVQLIKKTVPYLPQLRLEVGAEVTARYGGERNHLPGKIEKAYGDGSYGILYADGGTEKSVARSLIRPKGRTAAIKWVLAKVQQLFFSGVVAPGSFDLAKPSTVLTHPTVATATELLDLPETQRLWQQNEHCRFFKRLVSVTSNLLAAFRTCATRMVAWQERKDALAHAVEKKHALQAEMRVCNKRTQELQLEYTKLEKRFIFGNRLSVFAEDLGKDQEPRAALLRAQRATSDRNILGQ
jgi:hypothetical protein